MPYVSPGGLPLFSGDPFLWDQEQKPSQAWLVASTAAWLLRRLGTSGWQGAT